MGFVDVLKYAARTESTMANESVTAGESNTALVIVMPGALLIAGAPLGSATMIAVFLASGLYVLTRWGLFAMLTTVVFSSASRRAMRSTQPCPKIATGT